MDRTELGPARELATENGLEPRGQRETGLEEFALYVYDSHRNGLFYIGSLSQLQAHIDENNGIVRKPAQARLSGRRRMIA